MNYDDTDDKDRMLPDSVLLEGVGEESVADDEDIEDGSALPEEEEDKWE
jgi:hypothetical protein